MKIEAYTWEILPGHRPAQTEKPNAKTLFNYIKK